MAEIFHIDARITVLPPPASADDGYSLDEVKQALGIRRDQLVQQLPLGGGEALLVHEEAKLQAAPPPLNLGATRLARAHGALFATDYIIGNALRVRCEEGCWR